MNTNVILFDDPQIWRDLWPITLTRPVSKCTVGVLTIEEKWIRGMGVDVSYLTTNYLNQLFPCVWASQNILINSAVIPDDSIINLVKGLRPGDQVRHDNLLVAAYLKSGRLLTHPEELINEVDSYQLINHSCQFIQFPEDINRLNDQEMRHDYHILSNGRVSQVLDSSVHTYGSDIFVEEGAKLLGCSLNSFSGPIYIGKNAQVMEFAALQGPVSLRAHATVHMGAKIYANTSIGVYSKIGGEVKRSTIFPYSNKAHDGYLGDSVIGSWCNMGADTNISNMKNTYGEISIKHMASMTERDTGLQFCGVTMGDHSMCAINSSFYTGSVIGVFAHIFGNNPEKFTPSFSWGSKNEMYEFNKSIDVATLAMSRRKIEMTPEYMAMLRHIYTLNQ